MRDLPGIQSSSVFDSSATSARGISLLPPTCELPAAQVRLLLRGGFSGIGAGSWRTLGCCASHTSRLAGNKLKTHNSEGGLKKPLPAPEICKQKRGEQERGSSVVGIGREAWMRGSSRKGGSPRGTFGSKQPMPAVHVGEYGS